MTFRAVFAALLGVLLPPSFVGATEIENDEFGFRCTIPDGFYEDRRYTDPDTLYRFMDGSASPDNPANIILIQRLRGVIEVGRRYEESQDTLQMEGITTTFEEFRWQNRNWQVLRQEIEAPQGKQIVYCIQFPLSSEAVQLLVGGPESRDRENRRLFHQVAGSFVNTVPWYGESEPAVSAGNNSQTPAETKTGSSASGLIIGGKEITLPFLSRSSGPDHSGPVLLSRTLFTILGGLFGLWFLSKKLPRGGLLAIAVGFYLLGVTFNAIRFREVVLFSGALQMLGFAAGLLGLIDLFRKPRSRVAQPAALTRNVRGNHAPPKQRSIPKCDRSRLNQPIRR